MYTKNGTNEFNLFVPFCLQINYCIFFLSADRFFIGS